MDNDLFNDQEKAELFAMMMGLERCYRDGNISGIKDILGNLALMYANECSQRGDTKESLDYLKVCAFIRQKTSERVLMRLTKAFLDELEESMQNIFTEAHDL